MSYVPNFVLVGVAANLEEKIKSNEYLSGEQVKGNYHNLEAHLMEQFKKMCEAPLNNTQ